MLHMHDMLQMVYMQHMLHMLHMHDMLHMLYMLHMLHHHHKKCDLSKVKTSKFLRFRIGFGRQSRFSKMKMLKFLRFQMVQRRKCNKSVELSQKTKFQPMKMLKFLRFRMVLRRPVRTAPRREHHKVVILTKALGFNMVFGAVAS